LRQLGAVTFEMSAASAVATDSCEKGWTDNPSFGSRLVFDKVRCEFLFWFFGVETDLAETLGHATTRCKSERSHVFESF